MFCCDVYKLFRNFFRLLANTFEEERSLKFILAIGWGERTQKIKTFNFQKNRCIKYIISGNTGLPLLPCLVYGSLRIAFDDSMCWALPAEAEAWVEWIYMIPGEKTELFV